MSETIDIRDARKRKRGDKPKRDWPSGLIVNRDGNPTKGVANTLLVLTCDPAWRDVLAYDLFGETVSKLRPPPVRDTDGVSEAGEWTDADTARTVAWIGSHCGFEPSTGHVDTAVEAAARKNARHPVREYLTGLTWDRNARLDRLLSDYFGAEDSSYSRTIGPKWMISAVARVMRPGAKADCMLVLEAPQGRGKSTALRVLFSDQWFSDTPPRIGDKDSYLGLRFKWCLEFGELDSLKGRAITMVKNYLSATQDTYRPPYGRRTKDFPRQCVFAGSTNESEYLTDHTGNRRFWPVSVGQVDVGALAADRDQLWAEAYARFLSGETWYLDSAESEQMARDVVADRETDDPWTAVIADWLERETEPSDYVHGAVKRVDHLGGVTIAEVMTEALKLKGQDISRNDLVSRCGQSLRRLGWTPRQVRRGGARVRVYYPPETSHPPVSSHAAKGEQP